MDGLKGRRNYLDNQVAFSTIRLLIVVPGDTAEELAELVPEEDDESFGQAIRDGIDGGLDAFSAVATFLFTALGALLPFLPFILIGTWLWFWFRRREAPEPDAASGQASEEPPPSP